MVSVDRSVTTCIRSAATRSCRRCLSLTKEPSGRGRAAAGERREKGVPRGLILPQGRVRAAAGSVHMLEVKVWLRWWEHPCTPVQGRECRSGTKPAMAARGAEQPWHHPTLTHWVFLGSELRLAGS